MSELPRGNATAAEPITTEAPEMSEASARAISDKHASLWSKAQAIWGGGLAPKGVQSVQQVYAAIHYGEELGLKPMTAGMNIAVINGRAMVWGDVMLGLCRACKFWDESLFKEEEIGERGTDSWGWRSTCGRRGGANPISGEFTLADAKKARLDTKDTYQKYLSRMMKRRARSYALRDGFADVLMGLYAREEFIDVDQLMDNFDLTNIEPSAAMQVPGETATERLANSLPEPAAPPVPSESKTSEPTAGKAASGGGRKRAEAPPATDGTLADLLLAPIGTRVAFDAALTGVGQYEKNCILTMVDGGAPVDIWCWGSETPTWAQEGSVIRLTCEVGEYNRKPQYVVKQHPDA